MLEEKRVILLLEDDEIDSTAIKRALKALDLKNPLVICENGIQGLTWLENNCALLPCLILLDINMPLMTGLEFLEKIKSRREFKKIPVVVLTTSREETDRLKAFELGIAGYMVKPVDATKYLSVMKTIAIYWQTSEIPV